MVYTKEQIENIKSYNRQIKTIENFAEAVRKTVTQYLGYTGNKGFINMIREIFQNSADELMKDDSPCTEIHVAFSEPLQELAVRDNGRGIPHDSLVRVFASQHTSSNYDKKPGEFSSGRHGVGAKVTNACSEYFIVESYILGKGKRVEFKLGDAKTAKITDLKYVENKQGTTVTFKPYEETMGKTTVTCQDVLKLIKSLVPLLKQGAKVVFNGQAIDGAKVKETIVNVDGLMDGLNTIVSKPIITPIRFGALRDDKWMKAEIAFTFDSADDNEIIHSYGNFCPTRDGTHVEGFIAGMSKYFRNYMNKFYLPAKSKLTITNNDVRVGLRAIVTCSHMEPEFTGQSKEIISNADLVPFVRDLTEASLEEWAKSNNNDLQKICKYFKDIAEIRAKSEGERAKVKVKEVSSISGLPKKFVKPTGKKNLELFIMEGDSATGPAKNNRDNTRQGLFPIRGKIINAMRNTREKVVANQEVAAITAIIGAGFGRSFDIEKCKWEKVIIATDADPDGAHIRCLLLQFFLLYMQPLITSGRLYATVPPLYGAKINGKMKYFTDRTAYNKYLQKEFFKIHKLALPNKVKLTESDVVEMLNKNTNYIRDIDTVANSFAIDVYLLEYILVLISQGIAPGSAKFKKAIESRYPFLKATKDGIEGLVDSKYQTIYFSDTLWNACQFVTQCIMKSPTEFIVDGNRLSLYGLMKEFESLNPTYVTRYKGLGEMNGDQLFNSTLDPSEKGNRVLIKYTIDDVKNEIEKIKEIDNDKIQLLKDVDISQYVF